jgi:hypothetical protein
MAISSKPISAPLEKTGGPGRIRSEMPQRSGLIEPSQIRGRFSSPYCI